MSKFKFTLIVAVQLVLIAILSTVLVRTTAKPSSEIPEVVSDFVADMLCDTSTTSIPYGFDFSKYLENVSDDVDNLEREAFTDAIFKLVASWDGYELVEVAPGFCKLYLTFDGDRIMPPTGIWYSVNSDDKIDSWRIGKLLAPSRYDEDYSKEFAELYGI